MPPFLRRRLETWQQTWQRDLRMVVDGLAGRHPSPIVSRPPSPARAAVKVAPTAPLALHPRTLRVAEVVRETADAVTLILADPNGAEFVYEAGQFLTLLLCPDGDGQIVRRAYSACSSPLDPQRIAITSKRVQGGKVSSYLNERVQAGMLLQVLGPSGNFTPLPRTDKCRHLVLIAGGSGITPLISIAETVLRVEAGSRVSLIYGNRAQSDIIFYKRLGELAEQHPGRFSVQHVLSAPPPNFAGGVGMLDATVLERELGNLKPAESGEPESLAQAEYYLCGPEPMMTAARELLQRLGVAPSRITEERFASLHFAEAAVPTTPQPLELRFRGAGSAAQRDPIKLVVRAGETLLDAGLQAGAKMPFSCAMGGCGACKGRLTSGEVTMPEPNCLTAAERSAGYVLCCVARPRTAVSVELPGTAAETV